MGGCHLYSNRHNKVILKSILNKSVHDRKSSAMLTFKQLCGAWDFQIKDAQLSTTLGLNGEVTGRLHCSHYLTPQFLLFFFFLTYCLNSFSWCSNKILWQKQLRGGSGRLFQLPNLVTIQPCRESWKWEIKTAGRLAVVGKGQEDWMCACVLFSDLSRLDMISLFRMLPPVKMCLPTSIDKS